MLVAVIDCETIPNQSLPAECIPQFDPLSVKHGQTKNPAKRDAKEAAERAKFNNALSKKMSLHPDLCEVVTFCGMEYDTVTGEHVDTVSSGEPKAIVDAWRFIEGA